MKDKVKKSEEEWKKEPTPEQYRVLRGKDTDRPFTGEYFHTQKKGVYRCAGCGAELFDSDTKYDSGSGWPSFYLPISKENIEEHPDNSLFTRRTEILCARCGGHLGHVFDDGPKPSGLRYCVNSTSIKLDESKKK